MPLGERGQAQLERIERQRRGVLHQIAGNRLSGGRQEAAPGLLEVAHRRGVAAAGVGPLGSGEVALDLGHGR